MRAAILTILALVVIAVGSRPVFAADNAKERAEIRKTVFRYATCVVKRHHMQASDAILATAGNSEIMKRFSQIVDPACLDNSAADNVDMRFSNDSYQYAVADALVNADFATYGDQSFADRLPLAQPVVISADRRAERLAKAKSDRQHKNILEDIEEEKARAWLAGYGECVVRQDPVNTRYWLLTPPETPQEILRIKASQPALNACAAEGTLKFNRYTMRGTIAVNYYRLAMATKLPSGGSAH